MTLLFESAEDLDRFRGRVRMYGAMLVKALAASAAANPGYCVHVDLRDSSRHGIW